MTYTNFCCRSGGSNLNAGTRTGDTTEPGTSASFTYASGSWVAATGVFTVASGNPQTDGVAVGDFASVYADGSSTTGFVGRITARDSTTITVSLTAKSGSAPADGTGNRTLKIGGAWAGPSGSSGFPLSFITSSCTNSSSNRVRVNMKNDATYSISAAITMNNDITVQGYTTSYGDLGRATIDGGNTGASYVPLSAQNGAWIDLIFNQNGSTGNAHGPGFNGNSALVLRCTFKNMRGNGYSGSAGTIAESESFSNGQIGFACFQTPAILYCISHDNNGIGFSGTFNNNFYHCIADSNGSDGFNTSTVWPITVGFFNCDAYNNTGDGIDSAGTAQAYALNCNLVKNGGYGINPSGHLHAVNNGFGSGTQANTSGTINPTTGSNIHLDELDSVTYTVDTTPWTDPANGDFSISSSEAINAGRGSFQNTAAGYTTTVGYPDIGAAQHQETASGGGGGGPLVGGRLVQ